MLLIAIGVYFGLAFGIVLAIFLDFPPPEPEEAAVGVVVAVLWPLGLVALFFWGVWIICKGLLSNH